MQMMRRLLYADALWASEANKWQPEGPSKKTSEAQKSQSKAPLKTPQSGGASNTTCWAIERPPDIDIFVG